MAGLRELLGSPGGRWAAILMVAYLAGWAAFMAPPAARDWRPAGVPLVVWFMLGLNVLAILVSIAMVFTMDRAEKR